MKYLISYSLLMVLGLFFLFGCAETRNDITAPPEVNVHGDNALNGNSENFHAFLVKDNGIDNCQTCHSVDYSGGVTMVSCATAECHPTVVIHQEGINNPAGENFHGSYIADNGAFYECQQCHGEGWSGGLVSPSCADCHAGIGVHAAGILDPASTNFHGNFIRGMDWDLAQCSQCHGEEYSGGLSSSTCLTCHSNAGGPEACNTCHGDFSNPEMIAPPQGTTNETSTEDYAVGAHQVHLNGVKIGSNVACNECHIEPEEFESEGHIDGMNRAELVFGDFTNAGPTDAEYLYTELTCQNVYCHGNFEWSVSDSEYEFAYEGDKMMGNNFSPSWIEVNGTQAVCGTCHGQVGTAGELISALPIGHYGQDEFDINDCYFCHENVVNQAGEIIDPTLHINGKKNVFGN